MNLLTIPNIQDIPTIPLAAARYAVIDTVQALAAGGLHGVVSGLTVTQAGSPGMSVAVTSGRICANGVGVNESSGSVTIADADATNPRWDLICATSAGALVARTGTADPSPRPPTPSGLLALTEVVLARVWVPAQDTAITNSQIFGMAIPVPEPLGASAWQEVVASDEETDGTRTNTVTLAADSQLEAALSANKEYQVKARMEFLIQQTAGVKIGFLIPGSPAHVALISTRIVGVAGSSVTPNVQRHVQQDTAGLTMATGTAGSARATYILEGIIHTGAAGGDFQMTWAQQNAVANNLIRNDGSILSWIEA